MIDLKQFTTEALIKELEKRKCARPVRLENPDFTKTYEAIENFISLVIENDQDTEDQKQDIFETVITDAYGKTFWDWYMKSF